MKVNCNRTEKHKYNIKQNVCTCIKMLSVVYIKNIRLSALIGFESVCVWDLDVVRLHVCEITITTLQYLPTISQINIHEELEKNQEHDLCREL